MQTVSSADTDARSRGARTQLIARSGRLGLLLAVAGASLAVAAPNAMAGSETYINTTVGPGKGGKAPRREVDRNSGEGWVGGACINEYYPESGKTVFPTNTCGGNEVAVTDNILSLNEGPKYVVAQVWNSSNFAHRVWGWEEYFG